MVKMNVSRSICDIPCFIRLWKHCFQMSMCNSGTNQITDTQIRFMLHIYLSETTVLYIFIHLGITSSKIFSMYPWKMQHELCGNIIHNMVHIYFRRKLFNYSSGCTGYLFSHRSSGCVSCKNIQHV